MTGSALRHAGLQEARRGASPGCALCKDPGGGWGGSPPSLFDAASWVVLYTFAFRLILSVHLSAMPGAQPADLAAPSGGLFATVWSCHEFGGPDSGGPAGPAKKGVAGETCALCTAVAGSAAAMPDEGRAFPQPRLTSFSLSPAVSIRPAGSAYFHARPRGPPSLAA